MKRILALLMSLLLVLSLCAFGGEYTVVFSGDDASGYSAVVR